MILLLKGTSAPISPLIKGQEGLAPVILTVSGVPGRAGHMRTWELFCGLRELSRWQIILQKPVLQIINCRFRNFSKLQRNNTD